MFTITSANAAQQPDQELTQFRVPQAGLIQWVRACTLDRLAPVVATFQAASAMERCLWSAMVARLYWTQCFAHHD